MLLLAVLVWNAITVSAQELICHAKEPVYRLYSDPASGKFIREQVDADRRRLRGRSVDEKGDEVVTIRLQDIGTAERRLQGHSDEYFLVRQCFCQSNQVVKPVYCPVSVDYCGATSYGEELSCMEASQLYGRSTFAIIRVVLVWIALLGVCVFVTRPGRDCLSHVLATVLCGEWYNMHMSQRLLTHKRDMAMYMIRVHVLNHREKFVNEYLAQQQAGEETTNDAPAPTATTEEQPRSSFLGGYFNTVSPPKPTKLLLKTKIYRAPPSDVLKKTQPGSRSKITSICSSFNEDSALPSVPMPPPDGSDEPMRENADNSTVNLQPRRQRQLSNRSLRSWLGGSSEDEESPAIHPAAAPSTPTRKLWLAKPNVISRSRSWGSVSDALQSDRTRGVCLAEMPSLSMRKGSQGVEEMAGVLRDAPSPASSPLKSWLKNPKILTRTSSSGSINGVLQDSAHGSFADMNRQLMPDCAICFDYIHDGDRVGVLENGCPHLFHVECLKTWLKKKNSCPLCQRKHVATPQYDSPPTDQSEEQD
jgi:Ring finger domain